MYVGVEFTYSETVLFYVFNFLRVMEQFILPLNAFWLKVNVHNTFVLKQVRRKHTRRKLIVDAFCHNDALLFYFNIKD